MRKMFVPLILGVAVVLLMGVTRGTPAEAKAMLAKVVEHYKTAGRKQALADFSAGKAPFHDRDLYVVCIGTNRKLSANGAFPQYVGSSIDFWKDSKGQLLGKALLDGAARNPSDVVVHYAMLNPVTQQFEPKTLYAQKVGEDVCGVGAYGQ